MLEKLVQAYEGRFVLAKLNSDENPQVAALLGLRSIPHVVLFKGGVPVDQFNGALPESQVRAFLDRICSRCRSRPLRREASCCGAGERDDCCRATRWRRGTAVAPTCRAALAHATPSTSQALLTDPEALRDERQHGAAGAAGLRGASQPAGDPAACAARIDADPKDHAARFDLAALQAHGGDFDAAFEQLLEMVLRDKAERASRPVRAWSSGSACAPTRRWSTVRAAGWRCTCN